MLLASLKIQLNFRKYLARKRFLSSKAILIQKTFRGNYSRYRHLPRVRRDAALRAAYHNDSGLLERLIPFVTDETDDFGNNCLHMAASGGSKRTLKLCLQAGFDPNQYNGDGSAPLHLAVVSTAIKRDATTSYLLNHGAWVDIPDFQ